MSFSRRDERRFAKNIKAIELYLDIEDVELKAEIRGKEVEIVELIV